MQDAALHMVRSESVGVKLPASATNLILNKVAVHDDLTLALSSRSLTIHKQFCQN